MRASVTDASGRSVDVAGRVVDAVIELDRSLGLRRRGRAEARYWGSLS